jgi:hypothetical protein
MGSTPLEYVLSPQPIREKEIKTNAKAVLCIRSLNNDEATELTPNATLQARLEAGARHERTLEGVALQAFVRL